MNIWEKLQAMRVELQRMNLKKSGENKFAGYKYYELGDFMPAVNELMNANKTCSVVTFDSECAMLRIINCEAPDEMAIFTSPMRGASLKGAHEIQNLGAVETYQRRYLYMTAFEIVESDILDGTQGKDSSEKPQNARRTPNRATGNQKPTISDITKQRVNSAVSACASTLQVKAKEITQKIETDVLGRPITTMTEEDAGAIIDVLEAWTAAEIQRLDMEELR